MLVTAPSTGPGSTAAGALSMAQTGPPAGPPPGSATSYTLSAASTWPVTGAGVSPAPGLAPARVWLGTGPGEVSGVGGSGLLNGGRDIRRSSEPFRAQQLWDAIRAVRGQKQIPAITRMARYMNRFYQIKKDETQRLLDAAVEDNLIKLERKVGTKGHKAGIEEKAYRLPTPDMLPKERHDWYCFHCHSGGEVVLCAGCHRVFHEACIKSEWSQVQTLINDAWTCNLCKIIQSLPAAFNKKERRDLNHLLGLLITKIGAKLPADILARDVPQGYAVSKPSSGGSSLTPEASPNPSHSRSVALVESPNGAEFTRQMSGSDESWRINFLLKEAISIAEIQQKCTANHYRLPDEFRADVQLLVHNAVIFHGGHSVMANLTRQVLRECISDINELSLCRDCYRYANENRDKYWFCKPCRPLHTLVYAKQRGFPYWPAKVIKTTDEIVEVRFFGGYHQKATIESGNIKPISSSIVSLQVKRTSLWNKACEELKKHESLIEKAKKRPDFLQDPFGNPFKLEAEDISEDEANESSEEEDGDQGEPPKALKLSRDEVNGSKEKKELSDDLVSSSSYQETQFISVGVQTSGGKHGKLPAGLTSSDGSPSQLGLGVITEKELKDIVKKMRAEFDQEKKRAVNVATRSLERDLERLKADHATELEELAEMNKEKMSESKRKQWCFHCEAEAIYWCCWNTAYCSIECQQDHWHKEHKRNCRRKR